MPKSLFLWGLEAGAETLVPGKSHCRNKEMYQDWWVLVGNGNGHSNANPIPPSALYPLQKGVLGGFEVLVVRCLLFFLVPFDSFALASD